MVSPDAGGVERARAFAKRLNAPLAIIDKRRTEANVAEVMNIIGDVEGKHCLMVDDLVDTAGTLVKGVEALLEPGSEECDGLRDTCGVVGSGGRSNQRVAAGRVGGDEFDSAGRKRRRCGKISRLSVAPLLARAIQSIHEGGSMSTLFI